MVIRLLLLVVELLEAVPCTKHVCEEMWFSTLAEKCR